MNEVTERQPITIKEAEAIMWGLAEIGDRPRRMAGDSTDPLRHLLDAGYSRSLISSTCIEMEVMCYTKFLSPPFTDLEAMILRLCIENTSWINAYRVNDPTKDSPAHIDEALATLRSLAAKLEAYGIEINHIPFN